MFGFLFTIFRFQKPNSSHEFQTNRLMYCAKYTVRTDWSKVTCEPVPILHMCVSTCVDFFTAITKNNTYCAGALFLNCIILCNTPVVWRRAVLNCSLVRKKSIGCWFIWLFQSKSFSNYFLLNKMEYIGDYYSTYRAGGQETIVEVFIFSFFHLILCWNQI